MGAVHPAAEQIQRQPAPLVLEIGLVAQPGTGEGPAQILGLNQPRAGDAAADRAHRAQRSPALVHHHAQERRPVPVVRVPVAVQPGEPRGRDRLVHRGPVLDPPVARGHRVGVGGELLGELRVQQVGVARPRAVVQQADDRRQPEAAQPCQSRVVPSPVPQVGMVWRHPLPQHGVAQDANPERSHPVQVVVPLEVARLAELVAPLVADAHHAAFKATPHLERIARGDQAPTRTHRHSTRALAPTRAWVCAAVPVALSPRSARRAEAASA